MLVEEWRLKIFPLQLLFFPSGAIEALLTSCPTATTALDAFVDLAGCGGRDRAAEEALQQVRLSSMLKTSVTNQTLFFQMKGHSNSLVGKIYLDCVD